VTLNLDSVVRYIFRLASRTLRGPLKSDSHLNWKSQDLSERLGRKGGLQLTSAALLIVAQTVGTTRRRAREHEDGGREEEEQKCRVKGMEGIEFAIFISHVYQAAP
jgi:hypothetical protein